MIGEGCLIGPNVVIGPGCVIEEGRQHLFISHWTLSTFRASLLTVFKRCTIDSNNASSWSDGARELVDPLKYHRLGLNDRPMGMLLCSEVFLVLLARTHF